MWFHARLPPRVAMACAVAVAAGVVAAGLDRPRTGLIDPSLCPGIVDGLAAWAARASPDVGVGAIVGTINAMALAAAVFAFVRLATIVEGTLIGAIAAALGLVVTSMMARAAAPGDALAIAAACVAVGGVVTSRGACQSNGRLAALLTGLVILAGVSPPDTVPLAIAGALVVGLLHRDTPATGRTALVAGGAFVIVAAGWMTTWLVPPMPAVTPVSCGVFDWDYHSFGLSFGVSFGAIGGAIGWGLSGIGPAVFAFAFLGVIASRRAVSVAVPTTVLAVVPLIGAGLHAPSTGSMALAFVAIWLGCAAGMDALIARATSRAASAGALAFVFAVPVLQHAGVPRGVDVAATEDLGHRSMTHRDASAVMAALPPGASLVVEDALTDVLLRSVASAKGVRGVPARGDDVRRALESGPVYVLPRAHAALQLEGLRAESTGRTGAPGLARITEDFGCVLPESSWRAWQPPADATGFALVAGDDDARGPVVMYMIAHALPAVRPHDASVIAGRGVFIWDYDLDAARDRERLASDGRNDALDDAMWPPGTSRFVKRIEVWRAPGVGRVLAIDVDGPVVAAAMRLAAGAIGPAPLLCPTVVAPVEPLGTAR